jgi:hypothetical protein
MNPKFYFLPLILVVLFSTQTSFAAEPTLEELRSMGPAGLQVLMTRYADEINRHIANPTAASDEEWQRITAALDTVAQQKNSYISGLYWHTDLESAKRASVATGKPILSLRLLGKLTDEFSCANSRFFRTVLYPNAEVSAMLRERFVLHWQSVRPVPKVTIDFGDGRKLERTLTGNSIHYILDSQARPIEALPGLYGPKAFMRGLAQAETLFKSLARRNNQERNFLLTGYFRQRHNQIAAAWTIDVQKIGGQAPAGFRIIPGANGGEALMIAPLAATKALTETTILRAMSFATEELGKITDEEAWKKIAQLHSSDAMLDERSISLIKHQIPAWTDQSLPGLLQKFQELIALDTVRNEYLLHSKLYTWLVRDPVRDDVEKLNEQVYAKLFLTPGSDPWLGLLSTDVYTALENGGVKEP